MYTNILLPVAFDAKLNIEKPLAVARALSAPGGKIHLLHVFETLPGYALQYVPQDMLQATREGVLSEMQSKVAEIDNATAEVADGSPGRAITDWAEDNGVDLIVMASHQPELTDILWGSTAAFVVRHAKCGVHVLR